MRGKRSEEHSLDYSFCSVLNFDASFSGESMTLTEDQLKALGDANAKRTPSPWFIYQEEDTPDCSYILNDDGSAYIFGHNEPCYTFDAKFILLAANMMSPILEEVRNARKENTRLKFRLMAAKKFVIDCAETGSNPLRFGAAEWLHGE